MGIKLSARFQFESAKWGSNVLLVVWSSLWGFDISEWNVLEFCLGNKNFRMF